MADYQMTPSEEAKRQLKRRFVDMGDGTYAEVVATASSGSGSGGADRELVVTTYRVKTAFTGASVGDTITATQVIDVSGETPSSIATIWRNQTTAADLASAPAVANLELVGAQALTDAQLRASAVPVSSVALGNTNDTAATSDTGTFSLLALVKRGLQNWTTLLARIPALSGGRVPVSSSVPTTGSGTILALTTAATGTNFTAFTSAACIALDIVNNTGTTLEYRRGGAGTAMQIPPDSARMIIGITNADQISVRRTDTSNTQVTIQAEAFTA